MQQRRLHLFFCFFRSDLTWKNCKVVDFGIVKAQMQSKKLTKGIWKGVDRIITKEKIIQMNQGANGIWESTNLIMAKIKAH